MSFVGVGMHGIRGQDLRSGEMGRMGANVRMDQQLFGSGNRTREEGVWISLARILPCGSHHVEL